VDEVTATAKYRASDGYVRYRYTAESKAGLLSLRFAAAAERTRLRVLLPHGEHPAEVTLDGRPVSHTVEEVESSRYLCLDVWGLRAHTLDVELG
jgi:hypothetical protein